ncbi:hypothetical protein D3C75_1142110 [compost metagenome]
MAFTQAIVEAQPRPFLVTFTPALFQPLLKAAAQTFLEPVGQLLLHRRTVRRGNPLPVRHRTLAQRREFV